MGAYAHYGFLADWCRHAKKLDAHNLYTMGNIAIRSETYENQLYKLFGKNAELIIYHAWDYEPCTMKAIKSYRSKNHSICSGQVLSCAYKVSMARIVVHEMADQLALDLVRKNAVCDQIHLAVSYDCSSDISEYDGAVYKNRYGKTEPKPVNGTQNLGRQTASAKMIIAAALKIYDSIVDRFLMVKRLNITANHVIPVSQAQTEIFVQYSLFDDMEAITARQKQEEANLEKEKRLQQAMIAIKKRFGKNAVMKAMNFQEGATAIERNSQVGGHKA